MIAFFEVSHDLVDIKKKKDKRSFQVFYCSRIRLYERMSIRVGEEKDTGEKHKTIIPSYARFQLDWTFSS